MAHTFESVAEKPVFPKEEEIILQRWQEIKAYEQCLNDSKDKPPFTFYDGPPFATGLPHYGHILAGTIKDVVCRYAHQTGHYVERRWGWDCHGLPVEYEIDKKLNINCKADVMKLGVDKYNEECRGIVTRFAKEWEQTVHRFGRWIDFENGYNTMDLNFMESTWWVFKTLFEKDQVYRAFRVMPFSTACGTTLSNFEVSQNYMEVSDPSIIIKFKCVDSDFWVVAWTTTPWTLPSNQALCVHPTLKYLKIHNKKAGEKWILGKDRWQWVQTQIKLQPKDFEILEEIDGITLRGIQYEPLFDYFKDVVEPTKAFHIICDEYVTTDTGTCIVHQAPVHGEDDFRVCVREGIIEKNGKNMIQCVDDDGMYTSAVSHFARRKVKDCDKEITEKLKAQNNLIYNGREFHNYPHCWRSDTPLIYKAVPSWFIKVETIRDKLVANNKKTHWVPQHVQEKRFHNWLSDARDWCVSRSRYWGTPIPIWVSDDFEEVVCLGSVKELEEYAGHPITDIHKHKIDHIQIPSRKGKGMLKRIPEVFDCWFESGSMPYGQQHYPFAGKEQFETSFPATFIAEGLDQTRGWFYTLMVLSTHLFDRPTFQNLIVNGLVLASDGKKMSKRLKNYPDPIEVVNMHGADAIRMYMCNSPVVRAEPLKFKEEGVKNVVREVFLPFYNAYRFMVQESFRYEQHQNCIFVPSAELVASSPNEMDRWFTASCHELIGYVRSEMAAYRLYTVVPKLVDFLDQMTNWYVRLNRDRMRGNFGAEEALASLSTLYFAILDVTILLAPVTPFITDFIYLNLRRGLPDGHPKKRESVHFVMIPEKDERLADPGIVRAVKTMQKVVEMGRTCRERRKVGIKMPLKGMVVTCTTDEQKVDLERLRNYVEEELNVMDLTMVTGGDQVKFEAIPNFKVLGKKVGKMMPDVKKAITALTEDEIKRFNDTKTLDLLGFTFGEEDIELRRQVAGLTDPNLEGHSEDDLAIVIDFTSDENLNAFYLARELVNRVQRLRKDAKLQQDDPVEMWADEFTPKLQAIATEKKEYVDKLLRRELHLVPRAGDEVVLATEQFEVEGEMLRVTITQKKN
eukprot:GEMP01007101.1.p1 GENE.GEMP01007101.1~~GEMP01007101.1.p1  ORF type:complete len:1075 (+),score=233.55 GEMP01007101.1:88-3312(+)